ncbi:hypothetical protein Ga0074812_11163 [Parafrankia irregularis]|uniref:Uncharacterized protein n=1 Tax=Parafrankia irregularis TaxID=795642 RepID=A0A0S4QNG1_9ACTN|nr:MULTISPECIES: hypothetical protein [Parafrankia]MBE3204256.1 hypothetical protein [Parafrankia sp. CH37]CUU57227.1 hypothetical protein Ga0074812_11163 [Parafrankia irregularis]
MPHPPLRRTRPNRPNRPAQPTPPAHPARRTSVVLSGLLLAGLAVTGCSSGSGSGSGAGTEGDRKTTPAQTGAVADDRSPAVASAQPGGAPGSPAAVRTTRIKGAGGNVDVGFVDLRVDGRLLQLDLLFTPRYADDPGTEISLYEMAGRRDASVTLIDTTNLLRYTVVEDSGGVALAPAAGTTRARNNEAVSGTYTFAAPPASVTALDVYLNDQLIVDDAPISR